MNHTPLYLTIYLIVKIRIKIYKKKNSKAPLLKNTFEADTEKYLFITNTLNTRSHISQIFFKVSTEDLLNPLSLLLLQPNSEKLVIS